MHKNPQSSPLPSSPSRDHLLSFPINHASALYNVLIITSIIFTITPSSPQPLHLILIIISSTHIPRLANILTPTHHLLPIIIILFSSSSSCIKSTTSPYQPHDNPSSSIQIVFSFFCFFLSLFILFVSL